MQSLKTISSGIPWWPYNQLEHLLGLGALTGRAPDSIPEQETKIPQAPQHTQKKNMFSREFPGSPVVKAPFQCQSPGFNP